MAETAPINRWMATFNDAETEAAYNKYAFAENLRTNTRSFWILFFLYSSYAVIDLNTLVYAQEAVAVRLTASVSILCAIVAYQRPGLARFHETIASFLLVVLGAAICFIIFREPDLSNSYYVALIQGGVVTSFLFRLRFRKAVVSLLCTLSIFGFAVHQKEPADQALLQFFIILTMYGLCAVGIYFIQIHLRQDFAKARIISIQNQQLTEMLESVQSDNERKIAAMNVLVHFVRTPVHQIAGFTDIVINELRDVKDVPAMCGEGVQYIKSASQDLSSNVSKLLSYHRLDEFPTHQEPSVVGLSESVSETFLYIDEGIKVAPEIDDIRMTTHEGPLKIALSSLAEYYKDQRPSLSTLKIDMLDQGAVVQLEITDDCPLLDKETFEHNSKPLTELEDYLRVSGAEMSMLLRTVRKAIEICGGSFTHETRDDQNVMVITLPKDLSKTEALVA